MRRGERETLSVALAASRRRRARSVRVAKPPAICRGEMAGAWGYRRVSIERAASEVRRAVFTNLQSEGTMALLVTD